MTLLKNPLRATDALPQLASKLPHDLFIEGRTSYGDFSIAFLAGLSEEQLEKLNAEAAKLKLEETNQFRLCFYEKASPRATAIEIKDFSSFDWDLVENFELSGDTTGYFDDEHGTTYYYVSVTFNLKA